MVFFVVEEDSMTSKDEETLCPGRRRDEGSGEGKPE